ncbi:hypothetical protein LCGC14_1654660 [marine sediment metagenome]|uniref:Uncharacterized protein n=2 Tax=root TaxID=1 RepID=A0A7C1RAN0_UNCAE|nr:hypothetical protein [Candidatus Aerophobetes bacterium]
MILKSGEEKRKEDKVIIQEFKWEEHSEESLQGEGNIFLTTQRLVLEKETEGKTVTIFKFPLKAVDEVRVKGFIGKVLLLKVLLKEINSAIKGIDFSGKKGVANLKIKVDDPKAYADEISFRSRKT